jgi:hypothetical protein
MVIPVGNGSAKAKRNNKPAHGGKVERDRNTDAELDRRRHNHGNGANVWPVIDSSFDASDFRCGCGFSDDICSVVKCDGRAVHCKPFDLNEH